MSQYNKAWVALIMALLALLELHFEWTFGISEQFVADLIIILSPILVWAVPNR